MSDRNMTRDEFEAFYAKNSGMTVEELRVFNQKMGREIQPCGCGDPSCRGWQMISAALYAEEQNERP